jgi:nucleoside 2-deoxyribosyltransferase
MIHVAGGVYEERCLQPVWETLYGSGGRAAAALASRRPQQVVLTTYVGDVWRRNLEARASQAGFKVNATAIDKTAVFSYVHPLSVPVIYPSLHLIHRAQPLQGDGEIVLRFGMLEGDAVVRGRRVVYDPQSATNPEFFRHNGSTADLLAVVANGYEVALLTGERDALRGAREILAREAAEVVVVKRGSRGALVLTASSSADVPAYETPFVFSIGSGDMFAAAFALFWGEENRDPVAAADLASRATARYCESQEAVIPEATELSAANMKPVNAKPGGRAYLAAPFFNIQQRWLVEEARLHMKHIGLDVFSPAHDVGVGSAEQVAPADLAGLAQCDRVLALVDGADTGTLFEVGYARARDIPVVALAESLSEEQLKMLAGSGCMVTNDFATAIYKVAWL